MGSARLGEASRGRISARSGRQDLQAAVAHRPVDAVAEAGAGVDERGLLARRGPGAELGAGVYGLEAPLHARVLRAELGDQRGRAAPLALDRLEPGLPLVGRRIDGEPLGFAHAPDPSPGCAPRFAATSRSHSATARVVSTSNS